MFQFMFLDPLNKMQIPITNAKVFKIYNYHYIDEEKIDTKSRMDIQDAEYEEVE